ncbi:kinase-like domain-containing protein [Rhizophagus irregularis DAOM 181602=DAOM 197198]|uniref:Kinase-like domain-containing protein n=1 Tax=Rhizophagus irregularis (strain DAOM 181602 / DAOM 197198 / MUCL 43194) TaxID=747089 RepID=A0A2P4QTX0_RHIID|nr:kinase-like domain-containing protein [Rhizophagus irregularis DAOM 181602=DAOM 197198]POG81081.1 kinase-like domain-containing protein [Rhizophagus irregularis DAOM 181602=DAOM 197198]|eukprot:XP_025187947.1 kinase-like domain-containing protein [Rhizophagus irregularis DAOM 181602=DAOM 197198]
MHLFDPTLESQDFTINSAPYGNCPDCRRQRTSAAWCKNCNIANLKGKFNSWTSGNSMIDEFIQYTQLNANDNTYLEWIDFNQFNLVKNTNKRGVFSSIYSAIWMEGPIWILDEEAEVWTRYGPVKVILKRLDNSQNINQDFVNQLYRYYKCLQSRSLADYFGMTKDPTSCYMFVMRYYENGNLYSYLDESTRILYWRDIVDLLWAISAGLNFIHERDLTHGNLHGGNILVEDSEMDSIDAKIADTGLHGPVDEQISSIQIYGVIPFVAPEVFNGYTLTKESDIYSFGMIMWMLSAGIRPYCDRPHDSQLIQEICSGTRPNIVSGTPPVFTRLMLQCLDTDPSNRPTASQLCECLGNWVTTICDDPYPSDLSNQFNVAEEIKFSSLEQLHFNTLPCHERAIYYSRLLNISEL